ncbi:DC-STAMP domain-containing protein 2-like [Pristis pectinata]|uniref:DC-STAMP domain-containing protein 2-like n=1 Tax=Pristis pectinata TaxID=685728 RepID=UPI00223CEF53|nr:DC-STAMP domain-containing protein 2-like [Pristis pectinata]
MPRRLKRPAGWERGPEPGPERAERRDRAERRGDRLPVSRRLRRCLQVTCPCCRLGDPPPPEVDERRGGGPPVDDVTRECLRSLGGFLFGLLFASLYGFFVLFIQEHSLWYCLLTTIAVGVMLGLGMGLSAKVRVNVFLMFPHIFSKQGRAFLLALAFGLVAQGPLQNIVTNFTRGADSIACGAELAMNQTRELMQKAKEPLIAALDKIKTIAVSAKGVGDRVRKFFISMKNSIKHIVRILRNIYRWFSHIGKVCNKELGEPYRKCVKIFDDAITRCLSLLGLFGFLCYIVNVVKPLCGLVTIIQLFCLIPNYIKDQLNQRIAEPISDALEKVAKEFEFNISMQHHFHIYANQSKSLSHLALDIMEEIWQRIGGVYESIGILGYSSTIMMLYLYIQALVYRKNYLFRDDYDNCYITNQFLQIDIMRARTGKSTVLPLRFLEACRYIQPWSLYLTVSEKKKYVIGFARVLRQGLAVLFIILLDYSIYWVLDMVSYHLQVEIIARSPVILGISVNGTGYASDIYRNVVDSFDAVQGGNITVISRKCALVPSPPNFKIYTLIGVLYGAAFFIVLFGCYVTRLRRYICSVYYPSRERERVCYLYNQIHSKRSSLVSSLLRSVRKNSTDAGHTNILLVLAARYKVFAWIAALAGTYQNYCMACGRVAEGEEYEMFVPCITPGCKGYYCAECYQHMNNICSVCMGPLAYQGDIDEEVDSSDSGKVQLWISAMDSLRSRADKEKQERKRMRSLLKRRIRAALYEQHGVTQERVGALRELFRRTRKGKGARRKRVAPPNVPETGAPQRSKLDFRYQDRSTAEETSSGETYNPSEFIEKRRNRDVVTVSDLERLEEERERSESQSGTEAGTLSDVRVGTPTTYSTLPTDGTPTDTEADWKSRIPILRRVDWHLFALLPRPEVNDRFFSLADVEREAVVVAPLDRVSNLARVRRLLPACDPSDNSSVVGKNPQFLDGTGVDSRRGRVWGTKMSPDGRAKSASTYTQGECKFLRRILSDPEDVLPRCCVRGTQRSPKCGHLCSSMSPRRVYRNIQSTGDAASKINSLKRKPTEDVHIKSRHVPEIIAGEPDGSRWGTGASGFTMLPDPLSIAKSFGFACQERRWEEKARVARRCERETGKRGKEDEWDKTGS